MSVSKKVLLIEKEKLDKDFNALSEQIKQTEVNLQNLKNNLNAVHGARQQVDKLLSIVAKEEEEKEDGEVVQDAQ